MFGHRSAEKFARRQVSIFEYTSNSNKCMCLNLVGKYFLARAGLKRGDVIVMANGEEMREAKDFVKVLEQSSDLRLRVVRGGEEVLVELQAEELI
jgi:S1-C subfamily serine protease